MVFRRMVAQNHLFLEKKMVSNQKTIFFSRKPKKPKKKKKTIFSKTMGLGPPKDGFFVFLEKKMVFFGSRPSFSREKDDFWRSSPGKTILFLEKKMVFRRMVAQNHLFLEKKMVSNQKTIFFSRKQKKTKRQKKPSFPKLWGWGLQKSFFFFFLVFLVFLFFFGFLEKKMVFLVRNHFFLEKKMVLPGEDLQKPSFSRVKDGFEPKDHLFLEKTKKSKKNQKNRLFQNYGAGASKRWFFWFFWFSRETDGFLVRNHLFLEKRWFYQEKTSKNHLYLEEKMVLPGEDLQKPSVSREKDGFTRRRPPKTIFYWRTRWFRTKKTIFFSRKPKKPSFGGPSPIVLEKMFFWFFVFFVFFFFRFFFGFLVF